MGGGGSERKIDGMRASEPIKICVCIYVGIETMYVTGRERCGSRATKSKNLWSNKKEGKKPDKIIKMQLVYEHTERLGLATQTLFCCYCDQSCRSNNGAISHVTFFMILEDIHNEINIFLLRSRLLK